MTIPAKKFSQHIDKLNELAQSDPINELALQRIKNEANRLLDSDKAGAFMLLGAIASLLRDEKALHRQHLAALHWTDDKAWALQNYSNSLLWVEDFSGALEIAQKAYELDHSPDSLSLMIRSAVGIGLTGLAREFCAEWRKLTGESHKLETAASYPGIVRDSVMQILEDDLTTHAELWKRLAKV